MLQFNAEDIDGVLKWAEDNNVVVEKYIEKPTTVRAFKVPEDFEIKLLGGASMTLYADNYLVIENDEVYPLNNDYFHHTFELASDVLTPNKEGFSFA